MSSEDRKSFTVIKIIVLFVLIVAACLTLRSIQNLSGGNFLSAFGPAYFSILIFTFWLLAIGYIIWDLFGEQISAPLASFVLQSGERILKPKNYSKARTLLAQNRIEEAIKIYEKLLDEDKTDITAYCELADIYHYKLKDYSAAFNCYEKIEQYARETADTVFAINRKVDIYLLNKKYPEAIEELEKITKKFPKIKGVSRTQERIKIIKEKQKS